VALEETGGFLAKRSIKREAKVFALELAVRMMDLTTLEGQDTPGKVAGAGIEGDPARSDRRRHPSLPRSASIRISFPLRLRGSRARASRSHGRDRVSSGPVADRDEARRGAAGSSSKAPTKVDMVIDRGAFLSGRYAKVYDEIVQVKEASGDAAPER